MAVGQSQDTRESHWRRIACCSGALFGHTNSNDRRRSHTLRNPPRNNSSLLLVSVPAALCFALSWVSVEGQDTRTRWRASRRCTFQKLHSWESTMSHISQVSRNLLQFEKKSETDKGKYQKDSVTVSQRMHTSSFSRHFLLAREAARSSAYFMFGVTFRFPSCFSCGVCFIF